ncbi:MAG: hypothetical protein U0270_08185 [Labilithrix sp.]
MASPARATLLFPRREDDTRGPSAGERPSERSLESVGPLAVLEAMVEQRRQSSIPPPPPDESGERPVIEKKSLGFIKLR